MHFHMQPVQNGVASAIGEQCNFDVMDDASGTESLYVLLLLPRPAGSYTLAALLIRLAQFNVQTNAPYHR